MSLGVTQCVCVRRISLGGEGNALHLVQSLVDSVPFCPILHYYVFYVAMRLLSILFANKKLIALSI